MENKLKLVANANQWLEKNHFKAFIIKNQEIELK